MAFRVVKQPDGKLAVFSDVVDNFIFCNATKEQMLEFLMTDRDLGRSAAFDKILSGEQDHLSSTNKVAGTGLSRWDESLEIMAHQHGVTTLKEDLAEIGFGDYDLSSLNLEGCDP